MGKAGCQYSIAKLITLANAYILAANYHSRIYAVRALSCGITICWFQGVVDSISRCSPLHHVVGHAGVFMEVPLPRTVSVIYFAFSVLLVGGLDCSFAH